jgi:hypothetical protein
MASIADENRIFTMLEKINEKLGRLDTRTSVIEDQNQAQYRELKEVKRMLAGLKYRCDNKHSDLEQDRHVKHIHLGERMQRIETIVWLIGSIVSIAALALGGGVIVRFMGS